MKVVVIGGGPAGMMSAYTACQGGADVILVDGNEKTGKKMYISGKGRCNLTNNCSPKEFLENVPTNSKFLFGAINKFQPSDTIDLFESNGLQLKTERGNRVFPASDKSSDVIKVFTNMLVKSGVKIDLQNKVLSVVKDDDTFCVNTDCGKILADKVIIATGGVSYPLTGSTGDGYSFAKSFGHNIVAPRSALCRILCQGVKCLEGLSLKNVSVSYEENGKEIASCFGEMLFTDDGVSGPCSLTLSSLINKSKLNGNVAIDLKPALDNETLDARILRDFSERMNKDFVNSLDALLPERLVEEVVRQTGISPYKKVNRVTAEERAKLVYALKHLTFQCNGLDKVEFGIVTSGGVDVKEINPSTMESKLVKGLYFAGEVIDVDAFTGGFNIQIALSTGFVAGSSASKE